MGKSVTTDRRWKEEKLAREFEILATIFIKCHAKSAEEFATRFDSSEAQSQGSKLEAAIAEKDDTLYGFCIPILLAETAGYFDFVVVAVATSTKAVSDYLMRRLRASLENSSDSEESKTFGDLVADTQTSIGVLRESGNWIRNTLLEK